MTLVLAFLVAGVAVVRGDDASVAQAVVREIKRYGNDAKDIARAPARWDRSEWSRFAAGAAATAIVFAVDRKLYDEVQDHRSRFTDNFAEVITPFGGGRALNISVLMIGSGVWFRDDTLRDAGRDALESTIFAGSITTPLLKRAFGRARPIQEEGTYSFHPLSGSRQSFPSGHATNAFAFATAVAAHYDGWLVPTIVYSMASGVAFSRVNDRAHFPSDVVAGALIGRAMAKAVVHRYTHGSTTWTVVPSLFDGQRGVTIHIMTR